MPKLVSIVLPVYNGETYLRESIESVITQTYSNWELLIIDDGSTDGTERIAQEYVQRDSRITYYKNEKNLRLPRTLNRGFALAAGDYLTWTSDDNRYYSTALEKLVTVLERENCEFVFASCDVINGEGAAIECIMVGKNAPKRIVGENPVGACFLYTRKVFETVGEYDPEMTLVEDFDYWQRICAKYPPACIEEKLYAYRWHDGALTSTMKKDVFNRTLEHLLLKNRPLFGRLNAEQKYYYYRGLNRCRTNLGESDNPYCLKYQWYAAYYFVHHRIPDKLRRMWKDR